MADIIHALHEIGLRMLIATSDDAFFKMLKSGADDLILM